MERKLRIFLVCTPNLKLIARHTKEHWQNADDKGKVSGEKWAGKNGRGKWVCLCGVKGGGEGSWKNGRK